MKSSKKNVKNPFIMYSDDELIVKTRQVIFNITSIPFKRDVTPIILEILRARDVFRNACIKEKDEGQVDLSNKQNARCALLRAIDHLLKLLFIERDKTDQSFNNSWSMLVKN